MSEAEPIPPLAHDLHPYSRDRHEAFVMGSWMVDPTHSRAELAYLLRRPDVKCVIASMVGEPDDLLGWAAVQLPSIIWVYVRAKPIGEIRRHGLATSMLTHLGIKREDTTPCLHWSKFAAEIAVRPGYHFACVAEPQSEDIATKRKRVGIR